MGKKKLSVYWGNCQWALSEGNSPQLSKNSLGTRNKNRIDYSNFNTETHTFGSEDNVFYQYRAILKANIVENLLKNSKATSQNKPFFLMVSGGTASGKSSIVEEIYKDDKVFRSSYVEINYDTIKKEIPEYNEMVKAKNKEAARLVHLESVKIAGTLLKKAIQQKLNIIYEFNFSTSEIILERLKELRKKKYGELILFYCFVDVETAITRARSRARKTGRYVPEDYMRESYSKVPENIKNHFKLFDLMIVVDNRAETLKLVLSYEAGNSQINRGRYEEYLKLVGESNKFSFPVSS